MLSFEAPLQSELFNLLEHEELARTPILVLANKQVGGGGAKGQRTQQSQT